MNDDIFDPDPTRQDVIFRFVIARERNYEYSVQRTDPLGIEVAADEQPPVFVSLSSDEQWCTCDEDAVPGTCTHVLFLMANDTELADTIRDRLSENLQFISDEIEELTHELHARRLEEEAIAEAIRLVEQG